MNALLISLLVFAVIFGGALVGVFVRPLLCESHLHPDSKDVVKLATGLIGTLAALVLGLASTQTFGTGFQLNEQSASSIGNAFAAGAAFTDDVSAMWWNPAALSQFSKPQVAAGLNIIVPSIKFSNNASQPAGCYPPACSPAVLQPLGNNGGDAGGYNYTPNLSMVVPINQQ